MGTPGTNEQRAECLGEILWAIGATCGIGKATGVFLELDLLLHLLRPCSGIALAPLSVLYLERTRCGYYGNKQR